MTQKVTLPLTGGCQCGALRYRVTSPPVMSYACHCTNCQCISGSAFGLVAGIKEGSLEFTTGKPERVTWQSDAGNERYGSYCVACGCRIAHGQTPSIGLLSLRAGTLDDRSWIVPAGHTWTRSAQPWFQFEDDAILWKEQPTDYVPIIQRFQASVTFEGGPQADAE